MTEAELKSRLTVVETVYHQSYGEKLTSVESRFARELEDDEQPYVRRLKVGEDYQRLNCGWLDKVGMMVITNNEGQHLRTNPTEGEKESLSRKVLQLTHDTTLAGQRGRSWLIRPGESFRGEPLGLECLYIRCQSGIANFTLFLVPS